MNKWLLRPTTHDMRPDDIHIHTRMHICKSLVPETNVATSYGSDKETLINSWNSAHFTKISCSANLNKEDKDRVEKEEILTRRRSDKTEGVISLYLGTSTNNLS